MYSTAAMDDHPAFVFTVGSMLDERLAVTAVPTPAQLRVELLQHARRDLRERHGTERRPDGAVDVAAVPVER
jgi:hypothetical protein